MTATTIPGILIFLGHLRQQTPQRRGNRQFRHAIPLSHRSAGQRGQGEYAAQTAAPRISPSLLRKGPMDFPVFSRIADRQARAPRM